MAAFYNFTRLSDCAAVVYFMPKHLRILLLYTFGVEVSHRSEAVGIRKPVASISSQMH